MTPAETSADPDLPLVHRALAGDYAAFETLVERYEQQIYRLARRIVHESHDAEEVVQDTFLSVLEHLADFRQESAFRAWILRIAANAALKMLRKRRGKEMAALAPDEEGIPHPEFIAPWQETPADLAQRKEVRELLEAALQTLDDKYRVVFILRDMEEMPIEETARVLGLTPSNVKIRLMRARLMLREALTRTLGDPGRAAAPHRHE